MGEGVTNPTDSAVEGPSALWAACLKLVLLLGLSYVVALQWKKQRDENDDALLKEEGLAAVETSRENPTTSLTGPHLRRSASSGGTVSQIEPSVEGDMEENPGVPSESQPDSFFTWDSGGNSGDYSFVHTAVELPKYPDGAISEEERQMLLLYMQTGHPELLLNAAESQHSMLGPPPANETLLCDQATVRGFLETIVEENSDDLISPSDCDESSMGWGSWDESDDDRNTVVEMETSDQNVPNDNHCGIKRELDDSSNTMPSPKVSKRDISPRKCNNVPEESAKTNTTHAVVGNQQQHDSDLSVDRQLLPLSCASSVENCAFENSSAAIECANVSGSNFAELGKVCGRNIECEPDFMSDTKLEVSAKPLENSDFENLWISASNLSPVDTKNANPWCKDENSLIPQPISIDSVDCNVKNHHDSALIMLGSDDLCLVPCNAPKMAGEDKKLTFSDDFKDYFLPTDDSCLSTFELDHNSKSDTCEKIPSESNIRCFRIGFESEALEITNNDYYDDQHKEKTSPPSSESENVDLEHETLFSPREGDVVYGSSWLDVRTTTKTSEKITSSAEAGFSTDSPPIPNSRESLHLFDHQSASDDELQRVPNSLSRWQHHTDLQHVQEGTSPLTRWQHQTDLQMNSEEKYSKQSNFAEEDSDDGLPAQLKEIYSSFKMKGNKKGRIKIKSAEDKNNFKKLGLWDNDSKVTLPPFAASTENSNAVNKGLIREEDLDDLELDMFSVDELVKANNLSNADPDIADALKSFNHLDDYSSNSEENSESENSYTVNTVENIDYDNEELSNPSSPDMSSLKNDAKSENENTCSDNSDNCPLCTDPSFKTSKINDIFSTEEKFIDNSVQSLLLNTFPKIKSLAQDDKIPEKIETADSASPLTSSDSDEYPRTAKDVKKRIKRRLTKDNSNVELKHDDSGYVEDDEDDEDEDDSLEEKETTASGDKDSSVKVRKSLSSAFYESKSLPDLGDPGECIPKTFEEFSSQLQQSTLAESLKDGVANKEKWDIPEKLSQFSAWLLDEELKKISSRDEMEKMIVNDIMSLREQTIAKFLKNSCVEESCDKNLDAKNSSSLDNDSDAKIPPNTDDVPPREINSDSDKTSFSDENLEDRVEHSSEELDSEYYNYNFNAKVSKIQANGTVSNKSTTQMLKMLPDVISNATEVRKYNFECSSSGEAVQINEKEQKLHSLPNAFDIDMSNKEEKTECLFNDHHSVVDEAENISKFITTSIACSETPTANIVEMNDTVLSGDCSAINTASEIQLVVAPPAEDIVNYIQPDIVSESGLNEKTSEVSETSIISGETDNRMQFKFNDNSSLASDMKNSIKNSDLCLVNAPETINCTEKSNSTLIEEKNNYKIIPIPEELNCLGNATDGNPKTPVECTLRKVSPSLDDSRSEMKISISNSDLCFENLPENINDTEKLDPILDEEKNYNNKIVAPADEHNCLHNVINDNSNTTEECSSQEVAPSLDDLKNEYSVRPGNETDLLISDTRVVGKGAYQGFSDEIISPEAKSTSREVEAAASKHVTDVDINAYDELATLPVVNDNNLRLLISSQPEDCALSLLSSNEDAICESDAVISTVSSSSQKGDDSGNCSLVCLSSGTQEIPTGDQDIPEKDISSREEVSGFISGDNFTEIDSITLLEKSSKCVDNSHLNNNNNSSLYKSKSVTVLQTEEENEEDNLDEIETKNSPSGISNLIAENNKNYFTKSTNDIDRLLRAENSKNLSKIISSDDLSIVSTNDKNRELREEYKRSRSVGRDTKEAEETFESWTGQSKSTPDLSRCHDNPLNSSRPLSALLSKSVSQRIQDYLGKSTKGNSLSRSLPPNERTRHYRRICVSTETVVERAARFEARSKSSSGREMKTESTFASRSGSCPPLSMRTNDFIRGYSKGGYSKPTATIKPTVDIYRSLRDTDGKFLNGHKKSEEELFELITGYSKATKVTHKPPMAPSAPSIQQSLKSCRLKGKIASARRDFFEKLSQQDLRCKTEPSKPSNATTTFDNNVDVEDSGPCGLRRFNEFRKSAREERARLAQSHPDLGALEEAVRSSRRRIDQLKKRRQKSPPLVDAGPSPGDSMPVSASKDGTLVLPYRRCTGEIAWASCAKRLQEAKTTGSKSRGEPLEIVDERRFKRPAEFESLLRAHPSGYEHATDDEEDDPGPAISGSDFSRARSMDFLLDNREGAEPPENRLGSQRVKSEHELRIERSLQNLALPDWYTQSKKPKEGFILRRGSEGSAGESRKRWLGFSSSRTPSATSLTTPPPSSYSQRNIIIPKRVTPTSSGGEWRYIGSLVSSRESLTPASPASLSPRECSFNYGLNASLSRWSSSRLSTSSAPLTAVSVHRSFRQPYLGWRAAAASSSGGPSRSSPGVSPINATTPLQGSRPGSPRRGSQEHQYGYGLQQNQITSAATLRPDSNEPDSSGSRISPLALYDNTANVFFNSNVELPDFAANHQEMRRDRYSYTQSLYSGTVIVSPGADFKSIAEDADVAPISAADDRFSMSKSPQPPPRIWMESSFVGTKQDGEAQAMYPQGRTIRIVPSDSVRSSSGGDRSGVRSTCAPQPTMDTRELIDHLHNFLRGLQNRNQMIRPSSTSAFTPVSSSSNSGFHQNQTTTTTTTTASTTTTTTISSTPTTGSTTRAAKAMVHEDSYDSRSASLVSSNLNFDQRPNLVHYETEPKAYPRSSWRHSSSSSKDISPDNSSTDNELWLSVGEDMASHSFSRATPEHLDARSSSRSSISPPSPPVRYPQQQKRASEDSTGSARPIFFASSRRGSKGSNHDARGELHQHQSNQYSTTVVDSSQIRGGENSRKSSSTHSEESGFYRRDSKSGGSNSWRDSRTDQESSSASKAEKSSASMEEVLESLLAIPPSNNSRSSSPTSPRRSRGQSLQLQHQQQQYQASKLFPAKDDSVLRGSGAEVIRSQPSATYKPTSVLFQDPSEKIEASLESTSQVYADNDQGKPFDASLIFPPIPCSTTSTTHPLFPLEEVNNHGSFCRSSSTSPLEDDVHSPTSMEVLVPEGEEQDLSSIIEDETKLAEDCKPSSSHDLTTYRPLHQASLHECRHHPRPPLRRQSTLPSCSSINDPLAQPQEEEFTNLFAGLQPGSYSHGLAERSLRRPQSLCLVLLHLPCMFCARALAPPPQPPLITNSFRNVLMPAAGSTRETCMSEPGTPVTRRRDDSVCSFEPGPCCGDPVLVEDLSDGRDFFHHHLTPNVDSNTGRGPSTREEQEQSGGGEPGRKTTKTSVEGHLKCHRPRCNKSLPAEEARARFRTCPNCYTYYCSRQCRKLHLARHKDHCPQTRISNLCKQVLMKARDDPVSRRHLSLCARRGLLSRGRGAVKLLFLCPEDALDYLVHGWEAAKGQTLYVSRSDLLPQEMGSDVFSQVRNFCDKYNPERKFILLAAITVTSDIAQALDREVVVRGAKMHLSPSLPEDDVQTLILTISKTDPQTGDPIKSTREERRKGLDGVVEQLASRGVDVEKLYPHTFRKITRFVEDNEPFSPISIFPTDQRNGRVFMCIILPWADADIILNISSKGGLGAGKSSKKKWGL